MSSLWLAVLCAVLIRSQAHTDRLKVTFQQLEVEVSDDNNESKLAANDEGHVENCGSAPLNVMWSPKVIDPEKPVTIEGQVTTASSFDGGKVTVHAKYEGIPITKEFPFTCATLKTLGVKNCPVKKGETISFKQSTTVFSMLKSYRGNYEIKGVLTNNEGKEVVCGIVKAKVTE